MNRLLLSIAVGCTGIATAVSGLTPAMAATRSHTSSVDWDRCEDPDLRKAGARCAVVAVPLDYDRPGGTHIRIALSWLKAKAPDARRQGALVSPFLYFPLSDISKRVDREYDFVGFDPRGTGESRPLLDCGVNPLRPRQPAYEPQTGPHEDPGANERAWLARWDRFQDGCVDEHGADLDHYTSENTARDLDRIRAALGVDRISFYNPNGLGTPFVGPAYADLFPQRVRRMVLDSPVNPSLSGFEDARANAPGQERHVQQFWDWIADHDDVYGLGDDGAEVERVYRRVERELTERPRGRVGPAEWSDSIALAAVFREQSWPDIASQFAKWVRGNRKPILDAYPKPDPSDTTDTAYGYYVHMCNDSTWPQDYSTWREGAFDSEAVLAWSDALYYVGCTKWPARTGQLDIDGAASPSMLLLAPEDDTEVFPAALELRDLFPKAVVTSVRESITAPAFTGNECVDRTIKLYLRDGELPTRTDDDDEADKVCGRADLPKPLKADIKAAKKRVQQDSSDTSGSGNGVGGVLGGLLGGDDDEADGDDGVVIAGIGLGEGLQLGGGDDDIVVPGAAGFRHSPAVERSRAGRRRRR